MEPGGGATLPSPLQPNVTVAASGSSPGSGCDRNASGSSSTAARARSSRMRG
jgi:hypothetical protein